MLLVEWYVHDAISMSWWVNFLDHIQYEVDTKNSELFSCKIHSMCAKLIVALSCGFTFELDELSSL